MSKNFKDDFNLLKNKLITGENFGFARFSDGELFILQNKILELNEDHFIVGDQVGINYYNKEERKKFDPNKHQFYREKLIDSLKFKKNNYFKGISCKCCVGQENFNFQIDMAGYDESDLTWANLWNNGNYESFISEIIPIFKDKKVVIIINEAANLEKLPFTIEKDFRVHENCFINDYNLIEEIKKFIFENKIENTIFLISAASLSNLLVHQLFEFNDKNTYIDIGSTINPIVEMEGWKGSRDYLKEYWLNSPRNYLDKICIW
jgi:hypothetical protein